MITTKCLKIEIIIMRHKKLATFALIKYLINLGNHGILYYYDMVILYITHSKHVIESWKLIS